jgi:peptidoglycan/LPS O-acetylase OafA/YrhL
MASSYLNDSLQKRRGFTNFIRLAAAFAVLVSHSNPLSGVGSDPSLGDSPLGEVAVSVFFVLSGYFVFSSGLNHRFRTFAVLRIARLFPALIAANFLLAFF